jgi:hypothetical protein
MAGALSGRGSATPQGRDWRWWIVRTDHEKSTVNVSQRHAVVALESLVTDHFLVRAPDGRYSRRL